MTSHGVNTRPVANRGILVRGNVWEKVENMRKWPDIHMGEDNGCILDYFLIPLPGMAYGMTRPNSHGPNTEGR